jgi:hypothetical protein
MQQVVFRDFDFFTPIIERIATQMPLPFIRDISPLDEYLSICNIGTKQKSDTYLLPQVDDNCEQQSIDMCSIDLDKHTQMPICNVYRSKDKVLCVHNSRIKKFAEFSKEMGNKFQGKLTHTPYHFIIYESYNFYKIIVSLQTKRFYFLFNIGNYVDNFDRKLLREIKNKILTIGEEENTQIVLCGHSMGGSLALKCSEILALEDIDFFRKKCITIAFAPFPALDTEILNNIPNVSVYFTAIQIEDRVYIDPVYYKNDAKKFHKIPFTLLKINNQKIVSEVITDPDSFITVSSKLSELFTKNIGLINLHVLNSYLNMFYLFYSMYYPVKSAIDGGKSRKNKHKHRKSKKYSK